MIKTSSKAKLTLWIDKDVKDFGKRWSQKRHSSLSQLITDYLRRLKESGYRDEPVTPIVASLSGVIAGKKASVNDYKKHLEERYGK